VMCCIRACPRRGVWVVVSHVPSTGEVSGDVLSLCIPSGEWLGDAFSLRLPWGTGRARLIKQPRGQTGSPNFIAERGFDPRTFGL
jgi:hypothetical protein